MAHQNNHRLDRSLKEGSKDFQMWPLNSLNRATSTPLGRRSVIGKSTPTRKYSLASITHSPLLKPKKHNLQRNNSFDSSKRLYESYLSTQIDTQSPGFASRVVRYKEEQDKAASSRHYRLGTFPIVHFFKRNPPVLSRKSLQMNDSINSAELSSFNTAEHNKLLLEKIVKPNADNELASSHKSEPNTKSVLDALREISRKRIHSDQDDYSFNIDGKRPCLDFDKDVTLKNGRPTVQAEKPKGIKAMIDELTASFSSTIEDSSFSPPAKKKPITVVTPPYVPPKEPQRRICVDVETQTSVPKPPSVKTISTATKETDNIANEYEADKKEVKEIVPVVTVFDEKPLDVMRKKRLMILLGGESTSSNEDTSTVVTTSNSLKEPTFPVSILTTKKSPHKSEKHVTFNLATTAESSSDIIQSGSDKITPICIVTNTTTSLVTPIVFPSITGASTTVSSLNPVTTSNNVLQVAVSDAIAVATTSIQSKSAFKITDSLNASYPAQNLQPVINNLSVATTTTSSPFAFSSLEDIKTTSISSNVSAPSSTPVGGFKFDLKESKTSSVEKSIVTSPPTFTTSSLFSTPPKNITVTNSSPIKVQQSTSSAPSFSFSVTTTAPPTMGFNFMTPASTSSGFALPSNTTFSSSFTIATTTSAATAFTVPKSTVANTTGFSFSTTSNALTSFSAPSTTSKPIAPIGVFNMPTVSTVASTTSSGFAFTTTPSSTSAFVFSKSDPATTKPGFIFGSTSFSSTTAASSVSSSFVNATSVPTTNTPSFPNIATTNAAFPSAVTTNAAFPSATPSFSFSNLTNTSGFTSFSASATTTASTVANTMPSFGFMSDNSKSSFNTAITTTAAPPLFSATPATTIMTPFTVPKQTGSINFGFTKTDNGFGTTNPAPSLFDTSKTIATPVTTASMFGGNLVQSPFASNGGGNKPVFGFSATNSNVPAFPNTSTNVIPVANKDVGAPPKNIFGSFGASSTPTFGAPQTTGFPSTSTNQFSFGNTAFKPNPVPFATGKEVALTTASTVGFGQTNTFSSSFGSGTGAQKPPPFGANTNSSAFGTKPFAPTTQPSSEVFTFGSNAPTQGVFSFGASEPPRAATFNFGSENNSSNNLFGSAQPFGTPAPAVPSFGANNNLPAGAPAMFNIGTGAAPSSRQRLHLKAKRRT